MSLSIGAFTIHYVFTTATLGGPLNRLSAIYDAADEPLSTVLLRVSQGDVGLVSVPDGFAGIDLVEGIEPGKQTSSLHTEQLPGTYQRQAIDAHEEDAEGEDEGRVSG
jgi:hypothetical protein